MRRRIFVSHPLSGDMAKNRAEASDICREIADMGYLPISPLNMFDFVNREDDIRDDIMQLCFELIDMCDEVWVYGSSTGCKMEYGYARSVCKTVKIIQPKEK